MTPKETRETIETLHDLYAPTNLKKLKYASKPGSGLPWQVCTRQEQIAFRHKTYDNHLGVCTNTGADVCVIAPMLKADGRDYANAELIVNSVNQLPKAIDLIEKLLTEVVRRAHKRGVLDRNTLPALELEAKKILNPLNYEED